MTGSQIIGLGILVLVAAFGFRLVAGGRKIKPSGNPHGEVIGGYSSSTGDSALGGNSSPGN